MKFTLAFAAVAVLSSAAASELRGAQRRRDQAAVGSIKELVWVNADTNQRNFPIDGSPIVPVNLNEEFADTIDGFELPNAQLTMEAVVEGGPVGSVKFTFNGVTIVENNAPWALCSNSGADFMACQRLREKGGLITAQAFSGKGATGAPSAELLTYIRYSCKVPPEGSIRLYNADTDVELGSGLFGTTTINITETPRIAMVIDAFGARGRWSALSARFDYDSGAKVVVENSAPLVFPGNQGTDFWGFEPTVGTHTIAATLHSKKNLMGQNTTWGPFGLEVVV